MKSLIKIKKITLYALAAVFIVKMAIDASYIFLAAVIGDYIRLKEINFNLLKLIESYVLLASIFVFLPKVPGRLSNIILWLLFILSYIPMLTLYAFMDKPRTYMYGVTFFWGLLLLARLIIPRLAVRAINKIQSRLIRTALFSIFSAIMVGLIASYIGFSINIDFEKVYNIRAEFVKANIPLGGYLINWFAYIVNPLFFAVFLNRKNWLAVIFICLTQFMVFSATGNKAYFFALPFVVTLMWVAKRKNPLAWIAAGTTGMIFAGIFSFYLFGNSWPYFLFNRRVMFVPAQLSFLYYDYFSKEDPLMLSPHRFFGSLTEYPYALDPPHLIGAVYFQRPDCNATNGIYADAYMNFHIFGFLIWGLILAIILSIIDSFSKNKDKKIVCAAIAMPVITIIEAPLLTAMVTHGVLLSLGLLYLLPKETKQQP
jgi:hypothetical protein